MEKLNELFDLSGRVAVVTGSTKGMGLAIAQALGYAGAKIVVSSRSEVAAKATAQQLQQNDGITAEGIGCDISDMDSVRRFAQLSQEAFGRIDGLVLNAAGNPPRGSILGQGPNELNQTIKGFLSGNLLLVNLILPQMLERKDGSVIVISSNTARHGSKLLGLYGMAKAATDQYVRNLAVEIGASNVNANTINPGAVRTDFSRAIWEDPEIEKRVIAAIPLGRIAEANDVAGLALLLVSPAGRYITGQNMFVDGGRSAV